MSFPPSKFKGTYRIESNRLQDWDYGTPGYYFITICTQNRIPWFGKIKNNLMIYSPAGEIAMQNLGRIPQINLHCWLDAWIVMPNHIHAIISIRENPTPHVETSQWDVSTKNQYLKSGSLGAIINQYKTACTKRIRTSGYTNFTWQARYYDHIIRNEKSLENIQTYILENPANWFKDENYLDITE